MPGDHPDELAHLTPSTFESLVAERLSAMGMGVRRIGDTNRKDGGVDIIAWPENALSVLFLVAVQVKHSRTNRKIGPTPVRELESALARLPCEIGMLVTNTTFTADAKWAAENHPRLVRLRDMFDLMGWIRGDYLKELEWREIPDRLELAPGISISLPKWFFQVSLIDEKTRTPNKGIVHDRRKPPSAHAQH